MKPILFNGDMVRAILDGRKKQSRRPIKPQPPENYNYLGDGTWSNLTKEQVDAQCGGCFFMPKAKYQPGDVLYVRETWQICRWYEGEPIGFTYPADGSGCDENEYSDTDKYEGWHERITIQCADDCEKSGVQVDENGVYNLSDIPNPCRLRPSIHMPKWAARIFLKVTAVRVEKVQDITIPDAISEGITDDVNTANFATVWDSCYPGSWDRNDWVFIYDFEKCEKP